MKVLCTIATLVISLYPNAQDPIIRNPEAYAMSKQRFDELSNSLQNGIDSGLIGSAVGLIARDGEIVFLKGYGMMGENTPMITNAICRMASIGKTITAAGIMKLIERKQLALSDLVSDYLPEYKNVKVAMEDQSGKIELITPKTQMTIYHLLTHQSGITSRGNRFWGVWDEAKTVREFASLIAEIPLEFHPGQQFRYGQMGSSYELLAAIATVVTKKNFRDFLREEILDPLEMNDTYFYVPESKRNRLSAVYIMNENGKPIRFRELGQEEPPTKFFAGGGALRGTVYDYFSFIQCLLNGGKYKGAQIISEESVEMMIKNQVPNGAGSSDLGWGFGTSIQLIETNSGGVGSFGWNGGTGTIYSVDPVEKLIAIIFIPSQPRTPNVRFFRNQFVESTFQAIEVSKR